MGIMEIDPQTLSFLINFVLLSAAGGLVYNIRKVIGILGKIGRILSDVDESLKDGTLDPGEVSRIFNSIKALVESPEVLFLMKVFLKK